MSNISGTPQSRVASWSNIGEHAPVALDDKTGLYTESKPIGFLSLLMGQISFKAYFYPKTTKENILTQAKADIKAAYPNVGNQKIDGLFTDAESSPGPLNGAHLKFVKTQVEAEEKRIKDTRTPKGQLKQAGGKLFQMGNTAAEQGGTALDNVIEMGGRLLSPNMDKKELERAYVMANHLSPASNQATKEEIKGALEEIKGALASVKSEYQVPSKSVLGKMTSMAGKATGLVSTSKSLFKEKIPTLSRLAQSIIYATIERDEKGNRPRTFISSTLENIEKGRNIDISASDNSIMNDDRATAALKAVGLDDKDLQQLGTDAAKIKQENRDSSHQSQAGIAKKYGFSRMGTKISG